jgi:inhibitor of KinA
VDIRPLGDRAIIVRLGDTADEATRLRVRACYERLVEGAPAGAFDIVPGFASVAVHYDPVRVAREGLSPHEAMTAAVEQLLGGELKMPAEEAGRVVEIPVCYDEPFALDLDEVARHAGLTRERVIALHSEPEYVVHMIGFLPGFPYLGGLDPRLATPRKESPRLRVPAGSVGIGGRQTGVYTFDSPGGWQVIGRTPLGLFDIDRDPPSMLRIGDRVRFRPVSADVFRVARSV